jgi:hypothetical protein
MRRASSLALFFIIALQVCTPTCFAAFTAETVVQVTEKEQKLIALLTVGDTVASPSIISEVQAHLINKTYYHTVSKIFALKINGWTLCTASWQPLYCATSRSWVPVYKLTVGDALLCFNGSTVFVEEIVIIDRPTLLYDLTVDDVHMFCVGPDGVIAHNLSGTQIAACIASGELVVEPVAMGIACIFPVTAPVITVAKVLAYAVKAIFSGVMLYFAVKSNQNRKVGMQTFAEMQEELKNGVCSGGPRDPNEDKKNDYENHPHGAYHDVPYHHPNSSGPKSPPPKDGQRCLDYSIKYEGNQRLSIEGDTFVVLKRTSHRLYHGHTIKWCKIPQEYRTILQNNGCVSSSGRILKPITEKSMT